jgi:hypothetical protein
MSSNPLRGQNLVGALTENRKAPGVRSFHNTVCNSGLYSIRPSS